MKMKKITKGIISSLFILSMAVACSSINLPIGDDGGISIDVNDNGLDININDGDEGISVNAGQNEDGEFELNFDEGDRNISVGGSNELPADFPDYVPFPSNSELVQVITAEETGTAKVFNVILNLEGGNRLDEIKEFYTNHFEGLGYQAVSGYFIEGTMYSDGFIQEGSEEYVGVTLTYQSEDSTDGALALTVHITQ